MSKSKVFCRTLPYEPHTHTVLTIKIYLLAWFSVSTCTSATSLNLLTQNMYKLSFHPNQFASDPTIYVLFPGASRDSRPPCTIPAAALSHSQGSSSVAKKGGGGGERQEGLSSAGRSQQFATCVLGGRETASEAAFFFPRRSSPLSLLLAQGGQYLASSATEQKWVRTTRTTISVAI